jgi:hypothetical protein
MDYGSGSRARHLAARLLALVALTATCALAAPAHAATQLTFSTKSSDATPAAALAATATFNVVGNQLQIAINNTSAYEIADLYFNADPTLTGLALVGGDAAWSVTGGAVQAQNAGGFGDYNYRVDFGNGQTFLGNGVTNLLFNMTGATTEAGIAGTYGANPSNNANLALAVMKFQSGPGDDSAFGATDQTPIGSTGDLAPEGDSTVLLACGLLPFVFLLRRRAVGVGLGGSRFV